MTLYLKYRPQTISELDLESVREQLEKTVRSGKIPHAFLFAGPRGTGKTSAARILAKVVNCEKRGQRIEPCNKCDQCLAITRGSSLDTIEIDAASHRGVDDVRTLREAVQLLPAGSKMKVYIIDEAQMLTTEAANALLKTLEEPPQHAMFILATTAPEKLTETIRSRCTIINFNKARPEEVLRSLERAARGEKLKVGRDVLWEVAQNVDGSFRDAHKILEQLALERGRVTLEDAQKLIAQTIVDVKKLLELLGQKETKGALAEIDQVVQKGTNLKNYTTQVVEKLRQMLLAKLGAVDEEVEASGPEGLPARWEIEDLQKLIELFAEASRSLPTAVIAQLPLELAVVKWCEGTGETERVDERDSHLFEAGPSGLKSTRQTARKPRGSVPSAVEGAELGSERIDSEVSPKKKRADLEDQWKEIMRQVKPINHSIEALLRATRPAGFDGRTLTLEVFYQFHKERLENESYRRIVEDVASSVLGGRVRIICLLSTEKKKAADVVNIQEDVSEDIIKAAEEIFGSKGEDINVN